MQGDELEANFTAYTQDILFSSLQRGKGIKNVGVESERTRDWSLQQTSLGKAATIGFYLIGSFAKHRANQRMWKQHQELLSRTASPPRPRPRLIRPSLISYHALLELCTWVYFFLFFRYPILARFLTPVSLELDCRKHGPATGAIARHSADAGMCRIRPLHATVLEANN